MSNASNSPAARIIYTLAAFCNNAPNGAQVLEVRHRGAAAQETLLCFALDKVMAAFTKNGGDASELAQHVFAQTATWAESTGSECFFVAQWLDEQRNPLSTTQWKIGASHDPAAPIQFNGSIDSLLAMQQSHIHSVMSLFVDSWKTVQQATKHVIEMQSARISELEGAKRTNANATVDADTEIALQQLENERIGKVFEAGERILIALAGRNGSPMENAAGLIQAARAVHAAVATDAPPAAPSQGPSATPAALPASPTPAPTP